MRHAIRILVAALSATAAFGVLSGPAGAGLPAQNTLIIEKEVTGDVPDGTTFTVEVTCESSLGPVAQAPVEVTFDEDGNATSENTLNVSAGQQCTATETEDGGATSVTYDCDITRGQTDQIGPPFLGNCGPDDNQATFGDVIGDSATITVTNEFPAAPTTTAPTTTTLAPKTVPAAVVATPTFTG